MKNLLMIALFAFVTFGANATDPVKTAGETYKADVSASNVEWVGYKVTGKHMGTLSLQNGMLNFENGVLSGGEFTIDMTTLAVTDLEGEKAGKLQGHLMSPDFFGVESHPTAHLKITKVSPRDASGSYKVVGDLTIKNITKEIKFNAQIDEKDGGKMAKADITIDRTEYEVKYGSGSFFDNLGDKTIYDEFDLTVTLSLNKG